MLPENIDIQQIAESLSAEELKSFYELLSSIEKDQATWKPLPGPQLMAIESEADIVFYGGAAGGGKTDALLGLASQHHWNSIIFRRHYKELEGIVKRGNEIFGQAAKYPAAKYNENKKTWKFQGVTKTIELGALDHDGDETKFQGHPHDLVAFDEIQNIRESHFRFVTGWNRTTREGQRCRIFCTGNPPTNSEGDWVIRYWAPWLNETHPNPAQPGELRWYVTNEDGLEVEVDDGTPIDREITEKDGKRKIMQIIPRSRTFIPAKVQDNPYLMTTGYIATLQALPEPLRSKMLYGSFTAGREDDDWQIIPTEWVAAAQQRWEEFDKSTLKGLYPDTLGIDVARGGKDKTVFTPRYGDFYGEQIVYPGTDTPQGQTVAAMAMKDSGPHTMCVIDGIGVGASVFDFLCEYDHPCYFFDSRVSTNMRDRSGNLGMANLKAAAWWQLREDLDPDSGKEIMLPPSRELRSDLCAVRWKATTKGVQVEEKEVTIKRIGRSPDRGESLVYSSFVPPVTNTAPSNFNYMGR